MHPSDNELFGIIKLKLKNKEFDNTLQRCFNCREIDFIKDKLKDKKEECLDSMIMVKKSYTFSIWKLYAIKYNNEYYQFTIQPNLDENNESNNNYKIIGPEKIILI